MIFIYLSSLLFRLQLNIFKMRVIFFLLIIVLFAQCTQYKNLVYLQQDKSTTDSARLAAIDKYELRPGDLLHVRVFSPDPAINQMFNFESSDSRSNYNDISLYLNGFQINDSSHIELPVIGVIDLENKSMAEARKTIADSVNAYVSDASVRVKLLSYRVNVIGEVSQPGVKTVYRHQSNIFEVLGMAGDINPMGDRTEVEVFRQYEGKKLKVTIDLSQFSALSSPAYHIYPNDVIYVKPLKAKAFRENIPIISLSLTTITTFLLILNYFR